MPAAAPSPPTLRDETTAAATGATVPSSSPSFPSGPSALSSFGDYEVIEEIARGAMGVVYKARQVSLNRTVALKMVLAGKFSGEEHIQRFRTEAEAAAHLDHPHIVPIYEVGEHEGHHFFSMRLMEGGTLQRRMTKYGDNPRAGAEMLATVARAVHYAHQRGVLHRDLKPANILMDAVGRPAVTDFGLAKLLESDAGLTVSGAIMGTPSYMAPEQAAGDVKTLTTACDVYALGAILYHMLTGGPPFKEDTPLGTLRKVMEEEPDRPTTLNRRIDRDLETICLKCLEKDPAKRYSSAEALAEDLERWLRNEPITARRITQWERTVKFVKRHKTESALSAASFVVLVGMVAGFMIRVTQERNVAQRERDRAERHAEEARAQQRIAEQNAEAARRNEMTARRAIQDFFAKLGSGELNRVPGMSSLRITLLETALDHYEKIDRDESDIQLELEREYLLGTLARQYASAGETRKAMELNARCITVLEGLVGSDPSHVDAGVRLAHAYGRQAELCEQTGDREEHRRLLAKQVAGWEWLAKQFPDNRQYARNLVVAYERAAEASRAGGDSTASDPSRQEHTAALEKLAAFQTRSVQNWSVLATSYARQAEEHVRNGNIEEAGKLIERVVDMRQRLADDAPRDLNKQKLLAIAWDMKAEQAAREGRPAISGAYRRRATERLEQLSEKNPDRVDLWQLLAITYSRHVEQARRAGDPDAARELVSKEQAVRERLVHMDPDHVKQRIMLAHAYGEEALDLAAAGDPSAARQAWEKGLNLLDDLVRAHPNDLRVLKVLATVLGKRATQVEQEGDIEASLSWRGREIEILEEAVNAFPDRPEYRDYLRTAYQIQARVAHRAGDLDISRDIRERLARLDPTDAVNQQLRATAARQEVRRKLEEGDSEGAFAAGLKAVEIAEQLVASDPGNSASRDAVAQAYDRLTVVVAGIDDADQMRETMDRFVELIRQRMDRATGSRDELKLLANACVKLAIQLSSRGMTEPAVAVSELTSQVQEKLVAVDPAESQNLAVTYGQLAGLLRSLGRIADARPYQERALEIHEEAVRDRPDDDQVLRLAGVAHGYMAVQLEAENRREEAREYRLKMRRLNEEIDQGRTTGRGEESRNTGNDAPTNDEPKSRNSAIAVTDTTALLSAAGQHVTVEGSVSRVFRRGNTYVVNFHDTPPRQGMTLRIFPEEYQLLADHFGGSLNTVLSGRTVRVNGRVEVFRDAPQIIVRWPRQIEVRQGDAASMAAPPSRASRAPEQIERVAATDYARLLERLGLETVVTGYVHSAVVTEGGRIFFLNLTTNETERFSVAIVGNAVSNLLTSGVDAAIGRYTGRVVSVQGRISTYRDNVRIKLTNPNLIQIMSADENEGEFATPTPP